MICVSCSTECKEGAKFCHECGTALKKICSHCQTELPPTARFCSECGNALDGAAPAPENKKPADSQPEKAAPLSSGEAERRQLTVMFCDLVGSTNLASSLDPEEMRAILAAYRTIVHEIVHSYGSSIIQNYGDGAMVIFGYPVAREDATRSAVLAAQDIITAMREKRGRLADFERQIEVRVGINTGLAVVGRDGAGEAGEELSAIGDVPNMAARLQGLAEPGQIVVSESTFNLTNGHFEYEDLGPKNLKGFANPKTCYRFLKLRSVQSQQADPQNKRDKKIFGRSAELGLLQQRWSTAEKGDGQVVILSGEAGIGKSQTLKTFNNSVDRQEANFARLFGSSVHLNTMLHPVVNFVRRHFDLGDDLGTKVRLDRLKASLPAGQIAHLPLYARLFQIEDELGEDMVQLPPETFREQIFALLIDLFRELARKKPLLMQFEDIHWCDPTTLDFMRHLTDIVQDYSWMLIFTTRPEFDFRTDAASHITHLTLNRLGKEEISQLIRNEAGEHVLPSSVIRQIANRADGVALFAEEITRTVISTAEIGPDGTLNLSDTKLMRAIPDSLQASLMARLDRHPSARIVAQVGASIGRRFSADLLALACAHTKDQIKPHLDKLVDAELIYKRGVAPSIIYEFKHALVQDAAYQSLLHTDQKKIHRRIAEALETHFPEVADGEPEVIGTQYSAARCPQQAFPYHAEAGLRALTVNASLEAITHIEQALADLQALPAGAGRDKKEFNLLVNLAVPQAAALGYSHEKVSETYHRALTLADHLEENVAIFPVIYGMVRFHLLAGNYPESQAYANKLAGLADKKKDHVATAAVNRSLGSVSFYRGLIPQANDLLPKVLDADLSLSERTDALKYDVVDLNVAALSYHAWAQWLSGQTDAAKKEANEAIKIAESVAHPFSVSFALSFASWTYAFSGDLETCEKLAEKARKLALRHTFRFWMGWAEVMSGWARSRLSGAFDEGVHLVSTGIEHWKQTRSRLGLSFFLSLQADLLSRAGRDAEALDILDQALQFANENDERFWQPELKRLQGNIILKSDRYSASGISALRTAAADAAALGMPSLQLRALNDLLAVEGVEQTELVQMLQEVSDLVADGGLSSDVETARAILQSCAA